jgi:hypothetical protein
MTHVSELSTLFKRELDILRSICLCFRTQYVIYDIPTCFGCKIPYKSITSNRHTDTDEIFRSERNEGDITTKLSQSRDVCKDDVCHIEHSPLGVFSFWICVSTEFIYYDSRKGYVRGHGYQVIWVKLH